jgi:hypothetical protein
VTRSTIFAPALLALASTLLAACQQQPNTPINARDPRVQKWVDRAKASFAVADIEDASDSVEEALRVAPTDPELRLIAANVAIAKLDYDRALKMTEGSISSEALSLRGRAFWYSGNVAAAGQELETLLRDPDVHDLWAKAVDQLTHRGSGRKPFEASGSIVATVEMPRVRGSALVVPVEIDGEQSLAMIATNTGEVVLDKAQRKEPAWVSMRFGERLEFRDVPAITQDLSALGRQLGVPIKALLGVNFLRHANVTFDFFAQQFVVRRFQPPRPPDATDLPIYYIRGGGMLLRSSLHAGNGGAAAAALTIDTTAMIPIALDAGGWKKAGVDASTLHPLTSDPKTREGVVPLIRLGAFELPQIRGVESAQVGELEKAMGIDLDGILGSDMLASFRVTLGEGGKVMWIEEDPMSTGGAPPPDASQAPSSNAPVAAPPPPPPATSSQPKPSPSATPARPNLPRTAQ